MSALGAMADHEGRLLREFRNSDEAKLMVRLIHAECLLELGRVARSAEDLPRYLDAVGNTLAELAGLAEITISIRLDEVGQFHRRFGYLPDQPDGRYPFSEMHLDLGSHGEGQIRLARPAPELESPDFINAVAEEVSAAITGRAESELLRQRAALAEAARLVGSLSGEIQPNDLRSFVATLCDLPGIEGAGLHIDHPEWSETPRLSCGAAGTVKAAEIEVPGGQLTLYLRCTDDTHAYYDRVGREVTALLGAAFANAQEHRTLLAQATTDALTGVANRRATLDMLAKAIHAAERSSDTIAAIYFDLDHFKQLNDRFGHAAGDRVLVAFATHLRSSVRKTDTVGRIGGEEFVTICPGMPVAVATSLAERIIQSTTTACRAASAPSWIQTVSAGLAIYPSAGPLADDIICQADQALYHAKHQGRNRLCLASEIVAPPEFAGSLPLMSTQ